MSWHATVFCTDPKAGYSVSWEGDRVEVVRHKAGGFVTVTITGDGRRAHFVIPAAELESKKVTHVRTKPDAFDSLDFG